MGCAPIVSTMTSSGSMPTAKRSIGRLATKDLEYYDEGRGPVSDQQNP